MTPRFPLQDLPGADLIAPGLEDYAAGRLSKGSLLVRIGRPRLAAVGLLDDVPPPAPLTRDAEEVLYEWLCRESGDNAYSEYQSLIRLLVSFENAADLRFKRWLDSAVPAH